MGVADEFYPPEVDDNWMVCSVFVLVNSVCLPILNVNALKAGHEKLKHSRVGQNFDIFNREEI